MTRPAAVVATLLAIWALAWIWSFVGARLAPATGDGFTRGMNRIGLFLAWQGVAFVLALVLAIQRRRLPRGGLRRLAAVPAALAAALVLFVAGLLIWAQVQQMLGRPDRTQPSPVTAPAGSP